VLDTCFVYAWPYYQVTLDGLSYIGKVCKPFLLYLKRDFILFFGGAPPLVVGVDNIWSLAGKD